MRRFKFLSISKNSKIQNRFIEILNGALLNKGAIAVIDIAICYADVKIMSQFTLHSKIINIIRKLKNVNIITSLYKT